jgi:uncharacterized membrane protein (DUF485 family)
MSVTSIEIAGRAEPRSEFLDLVQSRFRIAALLSAIMIVAYFSFMALFAFDKPLLGLLITPYLSLAMLLGLALILTPVVLCFVYVVWMNRMYDPAVCKLRRERERL